MKLESLRLKNFRSYVDLSVDFPSSSNVVVFYGSNGQGKTNLIEAFYLLLRGESFRPATTGSFLRHSEAGVAPASVLEARIRQENLVHQIKLALTPGKKVLTRNGQSTTGVALTRQFPLVLFSPESLSAVKEGPDLRRQLLDEVILTHTAANARTLRDFRRALKTRNRILRDAQKAKTPRREVDALLDSLDPSYLPLAAELTVARLSALEALQNDFCAATRAVLQRNDVDISVDYLINSKNAREWSRSDILTAMHNRTQELRERELASGVTLVGPHKHDIQILFSGKDSRFFCSQGQQRALILSFKMAQILYHYRSYQEYPFLLLDDVVSELDPIRRTNLVRFLKDIPAQIFMTTTDLSFSTDFGDRRLNVFRIEKGMVLSE